jgi:hypothetical protein
MQDDTRTEIARLDERLLGFNRLMEERKEAVYAAFNAAEKAREEAAAVQLRVNASQNEFRAALSDQARLFVSRVELEAVKDRMVLLEKGGSAGTGHEHGRDKVVDLLLRILPIGISLFVLWQLNKPR